MEDDLKDIDDLQPEMVVNRKDNQKRTCSDSSGGQKGLSRLGSN